MPYVAEMACISMPSVTIRPVRAQLLAQQTGEVGGAERRREVGVKRGEQDVRAHHGFGAGGDGRAERHQFPGEQGVGSTSIRGSS